METFLEHNAGWIITLATMLIGFAASWAGMKEKVKNLAETFKDRLDKQDRVLDEIKTTGSPSSRTAIMVLNTTVSDHAKRMDVQSQRMMELEKISAVITGMAKDIEWIKREMEKGNQHGRGD